jgi:Legionella pneumophila major outer membrane protein precursor
MFKKALICCATLQGALFADATLAPSRLEVKDGYNMYLEGQFLWWLTKIDTVPFAQEGATAIVPYNTFNGHYKRLNTEFAPGGRLTFGGLMAYDHWDIHFTWTYFTQNASSKVNSNSFYLGNTFNLPNVTNYIRAKYNISLNMLDAIMTRPSWMGERLAISPYLGIRGTWLDQVFKTKANLTDVSSSVYNIYNRSRSDFRGAGLLAGFGLRYELKSGWCIEGNFLTSGIYGKFVNYYSGYLKPDSTENFTSADRIDFSRDPDQSMLFDVELKLGIGYNRFLSQGRYLLGGGLAWEEVIFLNGNRLPIWTTPASGSTYNLTQGNPSSLLTLQGITFRFMFGF